MTLRRALITAALAGGSLLISTAPAFADTGSGGDGSELPNTGSNGTPEMLLLGGMAITAGTAMVMVRRRAGARA